MLSVVALGGFAVVKMLGASKESEPPPPGPKPDPPPAPQAGQFPALPQDQNVIRKGVTYYLRFDFSAAPSDSELVTLLTREGFASATIFETPTEAAAHVPQIRYVLDAPGPGTRWARAVAASTRSLSPRPPALTYLWIATQA